MGLGDDYDYVMFGKVSCDWTWSWDHNFEKIFVSNKSWLSVKMILIRYINLMIQHKVIIKRKYLYYESFLLFFIRYNQVWNCLERKAKHILTSIRTTYFSFVGLLMALRGSYRHLASVVVGENVYLLMRKWSEPHLGSKISKSCHVNWSFLYRSLYIDSMDRQLMT